MSDRPAARYILMDVEGTTTSIHFVHRFLFPYALEKMEPFLSARKEDAQVRNLLEEVRRTAREEMGEDVALGACAGILAEWIRADRKHPALKALQGLLWQAGYEAGEIRGHVYDDVPGAFRRWTRQGRRLGIFSSGSVLAQKLLFRHSIAGDLTPFLSDYFDTAVGNKRETASYRKIAEAVGVEGAGILFLSDVPDELAAARRCGYDVIQLVREGAAAATEFRKTASFESID